MNTHFLFGTFPYAALAVLGGGFVVRYLAASSDQAVLDAEVTDALSLYGGSRPWRASVALLALTHVAALILPQAILSWNGAPLRLYLLEGTGFLLGLLALGGILSVARRHLRHASASLATELADCVLISLVFVGIASGLLTAGLYRWASSWGAATLAPYGTSILRGVPLASFVDQMPFLVQLHVFSVFALMVVFPFTRACSLAVFAAQRVVALAGAPLAGVAQAAQGWIDEQNPAAWIWPEETAWEASDDQSLMAPAPTTAAEQSGHPVTVPPRSGVRSTDDSDLSQEEADAEMVDTGSEAG